MTQSLVQIYVHLIFITQGRSMWIKPSIEAKLYAYIGGIMRNKKSSLIDLGGIENHIHLVIRLHQDEALSALVRDLKACSSAWLKNQVPHFAWQAGYGGFSCSKSHLSALLSYVRRQKEHHHSQSCDEELDDLAGKWGFRWYWDDESQTQGWDPVALPGSEP